MQNSINVKLDTIPNLTDQHLWADQADNRATFSQSNVSLNQNEVITPDPVTYLTGANFTMNPVNLEPSTIPYQANQPMDPMLWDSNFSSISLFGTIKVLEGDAKNIVCSLQRIAIFIKQRPLGNKDGLDIPQISDIGFVA